MCVFCEFLSWFHGKITREESEQMLTPMQNGLFLVRESTHYPGDYTLSICSNVAIEHYRIQKCAIRKQVTIDEESYFDNLAELIAVGKTCRRKIAVIQLILSLVL